MIDLDKQGAAMRTGMRALCVLATCVLTSSVSMADPPHGVTPNVIARGTYGEFDVKGTPGSVDVAAASRRPIDIIVREHEYAPGSSTGWHTHPGPVFITVVEGSVTFYEYDDPACAPKVVSKGQGYVDTGRGHIGRNESGAPAKDVTVFFAPVGQPFRGEMSAPGPKCKF